MALKGSIYTYRATVSTVSTRRRVIKLLAPVAILSVAINVPKFFETYPVTVSTIPPNHLLVEPRYYHSDGSKIALLPCGRGSTTAVAVKFFSSISE